MSWDKIADRVLKGSIRAFSKDAIYTSSQSEEEVPIRGVFDRPSRMVDPGTGAMIASTQPTFGIRLKDLPFDPDEDDEIVIGLDRFVVVSIQKDGQGGATLILHERG